MISFSLFLLKIFKSVEEVRTTRNSDGSEEKKIIRIIGDKAHSIIEKKDSKGQMETEEIFENFDESNFALFLERSHSIPRVYLYLLFRKLECIRKRMERPIGS